MNFFKRYKLSWLLLLAMLGASGYFYPSLPAAVPTKFDLAGNPIQYASKEYFMILLPALYLVVLLLVPAKLKISPEKFSMPNSQRSVDLILFSIGLLLSSIHLGTMLDPTGGETFKRAMCFGMGLFLVVLGNVMGKTERNFFAGVRVSWTLNSEANWRATHRFMGKLAVCTGIIILLMTGFKPQFGLTVILTLVACLVPVIYSYLYYRRYEMATDKTT